MMTLRSSATEAAYRARRHACAGHRAASPRIAMRLPAGTVPPPPPPPPAIPLPAGTDISLDLHLFNATDNPITGDSGILVKVVQPTDDQPQADMKFSGTFSIIRSSGARAPR